MNVIIEFGSPYQKASFSRYDYVQYPVRRKLNQSTSPQTVNPSNAEHKDAKIFENHLNHVMLVLIGEP